jgi:hypothetical protein
MSKYAFPCQKITFCALEHGKWRQDFGLMMPLIKGLACSGLFRLERTQQAEF